MFPSFSLSGDKTEIPTNINWVVLPTWPCMCLWIWRTSEVVIASSTCCPGPVCIEGVGWLEIGTLPVGCSLQLKLRDGYMDAAANCLMLRLADNNLSSSPSCLMLLVCSACLPAPLVLTVSSTDTAHKVQHVVWRGQFSVVRGPVIPPPSTHVQRASFCQHGFCGLPSARYEARF